MSYTAGALSTAPSTHRKDGSVERLYTWSAYTDITTAQVDISTAIDVTGATDIIVQVTTTDASGGGNLAVNVLSSLDGTNFTTAATANKVIAAVSIGTTGVAHLTASSYNAKKIKISGLGASGTLDAVVKVFVVQPY